MNKILILFISILAISCSSNSIHSSSDNTNQHLDKFQLSEIHTTSVGKRILDTSKSMIEDREIIVGGCWNYVNKVYERAGFLPKDRVTVFKSKFKGPYIDADLIEPGDWLYYVNHSYSDVEHSGIFIGWTNKEKREALMVSYPGENRRQPASYKTYNLDNIYNVIRAKD
jgi:hypothetical protein